MTSISTDVLLKIIVSDVYSTGLYRNTKLVLPFIGRGEEDRRHDDMTLTKIRHVLHASRATEVSLLSSCISIFYFVVIDCWFISKMLLLYHNRRLLRMPIQRLAAYRQKIQISASTNSWAR